VWQLWYLDFALYKYGADFVTCDFGNRQVLAGAVNLLGRLNLLRWKGPTRLSA
jgi:hypothetical protein